MRTKGGLLVDAVPNPTPRPVCAYCWGTGEVAYIKSALLKTDGTVVDQSQRAPCHNCRSFDYRAWAAEHYEQSTKDVLVVVPPVECVGRKGEDMSSINKLLTTIQTQAQDNKPSRVRRWCQTCGRTLTYLADCAEFWTDQLGGWVEDFSIALCELLVLACAWVGNRLLRAYELLWSGTLRLCAYLYTHTTKLLSPRNKD